MKKFNPWLTFVVFDVYMLIFFLVILKQTMKG